MPASQGAAAEEPATGFIDEETLAEAQRLRDMQNLEPTSAEEWKSPRKQGFLIMLPSGNVMRMRRTMNIVKAVKAGTIPNPLGQIVRNQIGGGMPLLRMADLPEDAMVQTLDLIDQSVLLAAVEPKVEIPPEDADPEFWSPETPGTISIMDLSLVDKLFITQVAQGGTTNLDRFREEQKIVVGSAPSGRKVERAPKPTGGTKRAGSGGKRKSG